MKNHRLFFGYKTEHNIWVATLHVQINIQVHEVILVDISRIKDLQCKHTFPPIMTKATERIFYAIRVSHFVFKNIMWKLLFMCLCLVLALQKGRKVNVFETKTIPPTLLKGFDVICLMGVKHSVTLLRTCRNISTRHE